MPVSRWVVAALALAAMTGPVLAHHSKNCRPYTTEKVCWEKGRPCHLHMVYARGHNPAGPVPDGYWYRAKPRKLAHWHHKTLNSKAKKHGSRYASCREFKCWYKHAPEHRY